MHHAADPIPDLKRQLASRILALLDGRSNSWAAWASRLPRSRVSAMRNGNLDDVSLERLVRCLAQLGHTVELTVTRASARRGQVE